jgi:hypothetical protein
MGHVSASTSLLGLGTGRFGRVSARSATRPVPIGFGDFQPAVNSNFNIPVGYLGRMGRVGRADRVFVVLGVDCGVRNRGSWKRLIIFTAGLLMLSLLARTSTGFLERGTASMQMVLTVLVIRRHISGASPSLPICSLAPPWLWICTTRQP